MPFPLFYNLERVGINVPNPTVDLDVGGDVKVSGALTVAGSAVVGVSVGAFGSTPNANGLSLAAGVLVLQPADATHPGGVSATAQSLGGLKTFPDSVKTGGSYNFTANAAFQVTTSGNDLKLTSPSGGTVKCADGGSGVHWATINAAGVEVDVIGQGFILKSPNGTRYLIAVANDGTLSASAAP